MEKNMKQFYRNQADVSAKAGKKGRKLKKNHSVETCKCFAPFVKLHWWDCPEVKKPCPIHGNVLYQNLKSEKVEPNQNVTVSFHPSSKTEKLFEPVKTLLAQCGPETKINFQYYSPRSFTDKGNLKHQPIQTSFEDLRKNPNNIFVEKSKSFVNEKTNKMKKLKECFHSPCNSIAQKYPSPASVRRNLNEISPEEAPQPWHNFFKGDANCAQNTEWFSSNTFGFKNLEKLSGDKKDSDFITVTQHNKDNIINHKIFEIEHRKELNEIPIAGFPKQPTQFAYSSFNVNYPNGSRKNYNFPDYDTNKKPQLIDESTNSENSQMSTTSAGSVYVTPFLLVPPGVESSDNEIIEEESGKKNVASQVGEDLLEDKPKLITRYVQISHLCESSDSSSDQRMNTVSLQTDPQIYKKYSECPGESFQRSLDSSVETVSEKYSYNEKISVRKNRRDNNKLNESTEQQIRKEESKLKKTTEVQTSNRYQFKEVLITRYNKQMKEAKCQVHPSAFELDGAGSHGLNKSLMTFPSFSNKKTQISLSQRATPEISDGNMNPSKVTPGYRELEDDFSNEMIQKRSERYYSDSEFFERNKDENLISEKTIVQGSHCKFSQRGQLKEQKISSAVSDLSELKKIIYDFFEKADSNIKEKESEMTRKDRGTLNAATTTDNLRSSEELMKKGNLASKKIQTFQPDSMDKAVEVEPTQLNEGVKQYRQSVLLDDVIPVKTRYICSFCGRDINKFSVNAATNTEESYAIKEKTTIIETDYMEITKVKKSKDLKPLRKSSPNSRSIARPITYFKTGSPKVMKSAQVETSPIRSGILVPASLEPVSIRNERHKASLSYRVTQDSPEPNSANSIRAKPSHQNEKQHMNSQTFRECMCNELPETFVSIQESRNLPKTGYSPSRGYKPDESSNQSRSNEDSKDKKENQKQTNRHFYHVTVNPSWPRDLTNSWKTQEVCDEPLKSIASQKVCYEKDFQPCDTYSSKKNLEESEKSPTEISGFEKPNFLEMERRGKHEGPMKENFGFPRMPSSSASQISMNKGSVYQSKVIKSEESVKIIDHQLGSARMKIFRGENSNDVFTVKSCHLNPIAFVTDGRSCDKLLACSVCKSLMFLKVNENDDVAYVSGPDGMFPCQNESEERIPQTDEVPERQSYEKFELLRKDVDEHDKEEYVERCSNFSDTTTRTIENDFFKEENSESNY